MVKSGADEFAIYCLKVVNNMEIRMKIIELIGTMFMGKDLKLRISFLSKPQFAQFIDKNMPEYWEIKGSPQIITNALNKLFSGV